MPIPLDQKNADTLMSYTFKHVSEGFGNLYDRWQDEEGYEDFQDYVKEMMKLIGQHCIGVELVSSSKRPFGVTVKLDTFKYKFQVNSSGIKVIRLGVL